MSFVACPRLTVGHAREIKMKKEILGSIVASLTLFQSASVCAQDLDSAEDEVVVYGVRMVQPGTQVGSSVTVITADDIQALGVDFVVDAIATAPGVTINQNGAFGGAASVRIRGASSEQTLVIVDGVVVNDPSSPGGGFDFARLDPANVARIEILRGPQSTLWGTDAIGGVVNIVTKRPADGFGGNVYAQAGSYGLFRGGAEVSGSAERFDFRLSAGSNTVDGISKADEQNGNTEDDGFESTTLSASGGLNLAGDARLQLSLLWTDAEADFDSFSFGAQGNVADGDDVAKTEELSANLSLQIPLLDGKLENLLLVGFSDIERDSFSGGLPAFSSEGDRTIFRYQGNLAINDLNRLAFGIERENSAASGEDTSIDGLFALYEFRPSETLTMTAGIRRDDHERFGAETTSRLAAAYNPNDRITVSASWGEGFKAPTLFQTTFFCCGAVVANANLRPEVSAAFDVGVTVRTADNRGALGLTYFDQDTTDLITFDFAIGGYENIAMAKTSGIELHGSYQFSEWARVSASYADIDAVDGTGTKLLRVPEQTGDITFSFDPIGPFSGNLLARYNSSEVDPNGMVGSWTRVDLAGRYQMSDTLEIYARVENLLDREYQQILGYGTPGISGSIGAQLRF